MVRLDLDVSVFGEASFSVDVDVEFAGFELFFRDLDGVVVEGF